MSKKQRTAAEKAALKQKAKAYIQTTGPYQRFLHDQRMNDNAFAFVQQRPGVAVALYLGWLHVRGELPAEVASWAPERLFDETLQTLTVLYGEGSLGGVYPQLVQDVRNNPEKFGHKDRASVERILSAAPPELQATFAEAERLETGETIAIRAAESDVEAGREPRVLPNAVDIEADAARIREDDGFQRRSALAAAWNEQEADAERHAPRVDGYTDREYREAIREGLRNGSVSPAEAVELGKMLDEEAAKRGELQPHVIYNERDLDLQEAYRTASVMAALEAGEAPPPATTYFARPNGAPIFRQRLGTAPGAQTLDPQSAARVAMRQMSRREVLDSAYETLHREQTGHYSSDVTGEPTEKEVLHDRHVASRIDTGRESLRDVVEAATDMAGEGRTIERDVWDSPSTRAPEGESLRDTLERAYAHEENQQ